VRERGRGWGEREEAGIEGRNDPKLNTQMNKRYI
jgi:hypothetical protein